jgi:hypothetical protein
MEFTRGIPEEEILITKKDVSFKLEPNESDTIIFLNTNDFVRTETHLNYSKKIYSTTCNKQAGEAECYFCKLYEKGYDEFKPVKKFTFFFYSIKDSRIVAFGVNYKRGLEFINIINNNFEKSYVSFTIKKYGKGLQSVILLEPNTVFDDNYTQHLNKLKENDIKVTDTFIKQYLRPISLDYSAILLNEKGYKVSDFMDEKAFKIISDKYIETPIM